MGRVADISRSTCFASWAKLGVLGAVFPEELGGSGYSYVDYSIVVEELARVDPSIALSVAAHVSLCTNHIYLAGSEEQKRRYIPKLASGEWIGCVVADRAGIGVGRRAARIRERCSKAIRGCSTAARRSPRMAHVADVCVVMAVTDRAASSHGISAFIVEKGTPGFRVRQEGKQAGHALFADERSDL